MKKTGEHFVPPQSTPYEIRVNLERYMFALQFCQDKVVIEGACGAGLGTYLYSLVAREVYALDHDPEALKESQQFPDVDGKVRHALIDLNTEKIDVKPADENILISLETIEHLTDPEFFLKNVPAKEIVFSVPMNALGVSTFHTVDFKDFNQIRAWFERFYSLDKFFCQENKWVIGHGFKK